MDPGVLRSVLKTLDYMHNLDPKVKERLRETAASAPGDGGPMPIRVEDGDARLALVAEFAEGERGVSLLPVGCLGREEQGVAAAFFEHMPVAVAQLTPDGEVITLNEAARALLGPAARTGAALSDLVVGLGRPIDARIAEAAAGRARGRSELARGLRALDACFIKIF